MARLRKENAPEKPAAPTPPAPEPEKPAGPAPAPDVDRFSREVRGRAARRAAGPERMEDGRLKPPDLG